MVGVVMSCGVISEVSEGMRWVVSEVWGGM